MTGPRTAPGSIEIRPIRTTDEYRAVEELQRKVWRLEDMEIVPDHLLVTANKNGGLLLGAFAPTSKGPSSKGPSPKGPSSKGPSSIGSSPIEPSSTEPRSVEPLVGFVFGFVGLTADGVVKHCSHMMGVDPDFRDRGLGYRLKLAQREHVLEQGLDLITWTFDPLRSRNANLNFRKLGVTCNTYLRNLYGDMRDGISGGLPSDRFQVAWRIASQRVVLRLQGDRPVQSLSELLSGGVPILNPFSPGEVPRPPDDLMPVGGEWFLIQIPADFQAVRAADMALAGAWRAHTRSLFEAAFAAGYTAVDLLFEEGRSCYLLRRNQDRED